MLRELSSAGLPLGLRDLLSAMVALVVQREANGYGMAFVAGVAAAKQMNSITFPAGEAFSNAFSSFAGQNFGAGKYGRIWRGTRIARGIMLIAAVVINAVAMVLGRYAISLFITGGGDIIEDAVRAGVRQLNVILACLPVL